MFERIKNLVERLGRKREISTEDFSKIYGAYAEIIRISWERMMKQLEEEGRENNFLKNNGGRISKSDRHSCGEAKGADCKSI